MFGYVKPFVPSLTVAEYTYYKSVYCGLCHTARGTSGAASRLFLSYDFVFLALVRQALQGQAVVMTKRRCVAHPLRRRYAVQENEALRYAAAAAAVLRAYKLQDDLFDEHGLRRCVAQLLRLCNRRAARRGAAWVCPEALQAAFADLRAIEQAQTASMDAPADVFGVLLGELFAMGLPQRQARIAQELGYQAGRWIYYADAADDLAADLRSGSYNPLLSDSVTDAAVCLQENRSALESAMLFCTHRMQLALDLIEFGDHTMTRAVLYNIVCEGLPAQMRRILQGELPREELPAGGDISAFAAHRATRCRTGRKRTVCRQLHMHTHTGQAEQGTSQQSDTKESYNHDRSL